jgi:hypothetical protein
MSEFVDPLTGYRFLPSPVPGCPPIFVGTVPAHVCRVVCWMANRPFGLTMGRAREANQ